MRKLDMQFVVGSVGQPVKSGSMIHLQNAYTEMLTALVNVVFNQNIGSFSFGQDVVLWGGNNTNTPPNYNIQVGLLIHDGELFLITATNFTAAATAVFVINTTFFTSPIADPVILTDGSLQNVHQIRTVSVIDGSGASPGFISTYAGVRFLRTDWITPVLINGWTGTFRYRFVDGNNPYVETEGTLNSSGTSSATCFNFGASLRPGLVYGNAVRNFTDDLIAYAGLGTSGDFAIITGYIVGKIYTGVNVRWNLS